jgi:predicted permease
MSALLQDLRFALRGLKKNRGLTCVIALSIGLALGANTTIFTWMEGLILNPYPHIAGADRLVALNTANADGSASGEPPISWPEFQDWRSRMTAFDGMAAWNVTRFHLRVPDQSRNVAQGEPVWGLMVSGEYFDVLGVRAAPGRALRPDDERDASPVAVISHGFWQRRFGGDQAIVGRRVTLNHVDVTIIGVAPPRFVGTLVGLAFDFWVPVTLQPLMTPEEASRRVGGGDRLHDRRDRWLQGFARLADGVTLAQANAELQVVARAVSAANGETPPVVARAKWLREQLLGSLLTPLFGALLAITGLVLLIACANVANLLLARAVTRRREIGVRLALGASRGRLARQLLTESLLLAGLGGLAGTFIALWGSDLFVFFIPKVPQQVMIDTGFNARVIGFASLLTVATALIFGLVPAWRAARTDLVSVLKEEGRGSGAGSASRSPRSWTHGALVVAQVALAFVTLVCAGLFVRSLRAARDINLGFADPSHMLLVGTDLNLARLDEANGLAVTQRLLERARALPGVVSASYATMVPLGFGGHSYSATTIEGYTPQRDEQVTIERVSVSDGYFETMGIPITQGRGVTTQDLRGGQRVAVINEAFARRYWPGLQPLGRRLDQGLGWATVVGVAKDSKYRDLGEGAYPVVYSALSQRYAPGLTLHVRTTGEPGALTELVRHTFTYVNADLPFLDPRTLLDYITGPSFVQFIGAACSGGFGALALLLASIGMYGVLAYAVNQRRREIGVRMALGATPHDVMRLVLARGVKLTLIGVVVGAGFALAAGRLLTNQLLNVSPGDPATFIAVTLLLAAVALLACYLPARRAAKVDPMEALRHE